MSTRNIVVTSSQSRNIDALMSGGLFASEQDVLSEALTLLETKQAQHAAKLKALMDAAQVGIDDIEAGRYYSFETPEQLEAFILKTFDKGVEEARGKDRHHGSAAVPCRSF